MDIRERRHQQDQVRQTPIDSEAPGPGDDTQTLRDEGQLFLAAADDAINRVLSRNSAAFLAQNRQMGGQ